MDFNVISPKSKSDLLKAIGNYLGNFRFGAGYTDLILDLKMQNPKNLTVINLAQIQDRQFKSIEKLKNSLRIGTLVTAQSIVSDKFIEKKFPVLHQAANNLASMQIRQVATVGGNLCTASPAGDISCALVSLNSQCEILSASGKLRVVPIEKFFTGVKKTVLKKNEVLRSITIPLQKSNNKIYSGFIKVGTRRAMECSVVSLSYHILIDKKNVITKAGISIGSAAPTIRSAQEAGDFITGNNIYSLNSKDTEIFAKKVTKYSSPVSDIRASAWFRKEVLFNISKSILENIH